jgi:Kef-type K+ transport system membrane component KefB
MNRRALVYPLLVAMAIAAVVALLQLGERMLTPHAPSTAAAGVETAHTTNYDSSGVVSTWRRNLEHPVARLILQILIIVLVARAFGYLARHLGQPQVVGEIAAGIALGPSLLGASWPEASAFLFPRESLGTLQLLSQIGVALFMFVVGLELDVTHLRSRAHAAVAVSHFSIIVPFVLGVALSLALYQQYAPTGTPFHAFALFMGIAMSITAFPVLARIVEEQGLSRTPIGSTAITCAAVDDVTAWTLLACVVAVVTSGGAIWLLLAMLGVAVVFILGMVFVVRPLLGRMLSGVNGGALSREHTALVLGVLFTSALATEVIGIHALFGAFVAGAIMPDVPMFRSALRERLESFSSVFLLPLFFAFTGLRTEIGLLADTSAWLLGLAIIGVATVGKLGASLVAARWTGMSWEESFVLGALMNTRGLMELIALNVGYDLGILSPQVFAMMVLMALVTTAMAGPLVNLGLARRARHPSLERAQREGISAR